MNDLKKCSKEDLRKRLINFMKDENVSKSTTYGELHAKNELTRVTVAVNDENYKHTEPVRWVKVCQRIPTVKTKWLFLKETVYYTNEYLFKCDSDSEYNFDELYQFFEETRKAEELEESKNQQNQKDLDLCSAIKVLDEF